MGPLKLATAVFNSRGKVGWVGMHVLGGVALEDDIKRD